jgi:hypothetical protein
MDKDNNTFVISPATRKEEITYVDVPAKFGEYQLFSLSEVWDLAWYEVLRYYVFIIKSGSSGNYWACAPVQVGPGDWVMMTYDLPNKRICNNRLNANLIVANLLDCNKFGEAVKLLLPQTNEDFRVVGIIKSPSDNSNCRSLDVQQG